MPLRWQEVATPLFVIFVFVILKHLPVAADLPLARAAGVVSFAYAAFLALRLVQSEEPVLADGWTELRPSIVEYFAAYGAAALAAAVMSVVIISGFKAVDPAQMIAAFIASLALAGVAAAIGVTGLFVKIRWNHQELQHVNAFGRVTILTWSDVRSVRPNWRGVTIKTHNDLVVFSQFHSGAAHLVKHAGHHVRRNMAAAAKSLAAT